MKFSKQIQILPALLLLFFTTTAQPPVLPGYTVQIFGAANGLLSSEMLSLYQDTKDFVWIGTRSGISRYDGRQFENTEYVGDKHIGAVNAIAEDKQGTLWIACENGLYYWDNKSFVHYPFSDEKEFLPLTTIHFTSDNEAWIGTIRGPSHFSGLQKGASPSLQKNMVSNWQKVARHDAKISAISSSSKGVVFGAQTSVYVLQASGLMELPNKTPERERIEGVYIDEAGTVYWNNIVTGLRYWNHSDVQRINAPALFYDIVSKDKEAFVYTNETIFRLDVANKKFITEADISGLQLRSPTCLLIDKEGGYWAGTLEGLFRIQKNYFTTHIHNKLPFTDDVYSFYQRTNGEKLIGANRGKLFEFKNGLQPFATLPQVVPTAEVFDITEDENGIWAATGYQGISLFKNGRLKNFSQANGLPDDTHLSFYKDRQGGLWTAGDMGITQIKKHSRDSFSFKPFFYQTYIGIHRMTGIVAAPNGTLWAGGQLGLFQLVNDSLIPYQLPELHNKTVSVTAIKQATNGDVWLATRGLGILWCVFDDNNQLHLKRQWTQDDGLCTNTWLSIAFDRNGYVWAGHYSGVSVLKKVMGTGEFRIKNFDDKDGFLQKNYQSLRLFANGDTMWACTSAGAVSFMPASLLMQSRKARLYITSIDVLNSQRNAGEFVVRNNMEDSYSFPSTINSFSVHFAALYYSNPEAVHYYYQLQGIDSSWTSTGTERTIIFRQLPPGQYKLLVKASIGGSNWTNTATLHFQIEKPWWLQWWVIALTIAALLTTIYLFIWQRERKLHQREEQKIAFEKIKTTAFQYQLEIQQVINYFTSSMNKHSTIDDMLWDVAQNCISKLAFEDCVIYLLDAETGMLQQKAAWGPKTTAANKIIDPLEIALGKGIVGWVAVTGKAEKIGDTSKDNRYIVDDAARASEITVPIYEADKVIGVIDSEHHQPHFYTERHLQILTTIASHCGERISTIKAENRMAAARMEALLSKQKALEASLQSMRLQMNPHFLFNALNSIQQMILAGDETMATRFLSKFSKLLRTVLANSSRDTVSLKEEMELLQLYIELESLRFKDSFHYTVHCDPLLDAEEVLIPSLLLQPLVENAIWHGLMHKEGKRNLFIDFTPCGDDCLQCTIEDNGVGRRASAATTSEDVHAGKGLSVALERLQALNEQQAMQNSLQVQDLVDNNNHALGTRIILKLYY